MQIASHIRSLLLTGVISLFLVVFLGPVAAHSEDADDSKKFDELTPAEKLYINQCAACHTWGGTGKGIFRPLIGITDRLEKKPIVKIIKDGREETGMPAFPNLTDSEMEALYTYLSTLKPSESEQDSEKSGEKTEDSDQEKVRKPIPVSALYWMKKPVTQPVIEAYKLAEEHASLFDELPCFCNCASLEHNSLLDCYRTTHGMSCPLCRAEARKADRLSKAGKSNAIIALEIVKRFWRERIEPE